MIISIDKIVIRKMNDEESDYKLMAKWLSDEHILKFFQGRDNPSNINQIMDKYGPRTKEGSRVTPCIIDFNEEAIGYIQYYTIDNDEKVEYGYENNELIYGIDLFIGEIEYQDKGIGEKVIKSLINYIQINKCPDRIIIDPRIDPRIDNSRAIRCYEKCGFITKKLLPGHELHEGAHCNNLLMEIECKFSSHGFNEGGANA
jgi:aminoglycoside 6'-N-acetyltransferase